MPKWINLLFLSFATAAAGEAFFFTFIDPKLLYLFGEPVNWSPTVVFTPSVSSCSGASPASPQPSSP